MVIPGSGRDADSYRDSWIKTAEAQNVLVAALGYPEADYDFAAYQMGGVIRNLEIRNAPSTPDGRLPESLHLRDEDISLQFNDRQETWLFGDFDRVFALVAAATKSQRTGYDLFGHSAGGQILHRLALFYPQSKAERIVAANAGTYTVPDLNVPLPFGMKDAETTPQALKAALNVKLTLLLGGEDTDPEHGGEQIHTPLADRQGLDRLSRGRYFFQAGKARAVALNAPFSWALEVIPGVGHDGARMSEAAARYLYS